ncbi:ASCH domain-containing protein [Kordiimonas aestuarii]|uniref:ASCH domain-containing protein n=1 Tax=Kordiimonas aestuarii TaxID=1005925 RepID=UPI0021D01039|nr:ASCH domain-containing protein [Kordiimonas aestuarii]
MNVRELEKLYPGAATFHFGDNEALCRELTELVRSGRKTATCEALDAFFETGAALPEEGRKDIVLNWDDSPALVIETISVEWVRFCDVGEKFALAEGEDDSLEGWREGHKRYFERNGNFSPSMVLVCERFKLVRDLAKG